MIAQDSRDKEKGWLIRVARGLHQEIKRAQGAKKEQ